ncbi:MAG: hypothetical protein PUP91_20720 [Rhizonema sp. PD37]|nr:hypothetical protein [Rhizonema sp. PD37]
MTLRDMMNQKPIKPPEELVQQAKLYPNGWVYQIDGKFSPNQAVPPEAIMGAWKVDSNGNIQGEFLPNPNYKQK